MDMGLGWAWMVSLSLSLSLANFQMGEGIEYNGNTHEGSRLTWWREKVSGQLDSTGWSVDREREGETK